MRAWIGALVGIGLAGAIAVSPALAQAPAAANDPGQFISGLGGRVIELISDQQQPAAQRKQQFATLVDEAFDMDGIARFILGPYWRSATDQQRSEFAQVFKTYMINVYWSDFSQYRGQKLSVTGQRPESPTVTVVSSEIDQSGGKPPVKVEWHVANQNGALKITDVSIAGVSELITYRQEFGNVIAQAGGNVGALTAQLRQKIQQTGGA
jgi:phospholipid transport system substrate-binding protein